MGYKKDEVAPRDRVITFRVSKELGKALDEYLSQKGWDSAGPFLREMTAITIDRPDLGESGELAQRSAEIQRKLAKTDKGTAHGKDHTTKKKRNT